MYFHQAFIYAVPLIYSVSVKGRNREKHSVPPQATSSTSLCHLVLLQSINVFMIISITDMLRDILRNFVIVHIHNVIQNQLYFKVEKCEFYLTAIVFLGSSSAQGPRWRQWWNGPFMASNKSSLALPFFTRDSSKGFSTMASPLAVFL